MLDQFLEIVANFIINIISLFGYFGIVMAMAIESALIPLPSEIIMPFSGFLVSEGRFSLFGVALAGAVGNVIGSWAAYGLGFWGHEKVVRRFIQKFGKFLLLSEHDLDVSKRFLNRYGDIIVLVSRVLPAVRTVISLPCGIARLPFWRFTLLTFIGSFIWSLLLAYIGFILAENWKIIGPFFHKFDILILIIAMIALATYIYLKLKQNNLNEKD